MGGHSRIRNSEIRVGDCDASLLEGLDNARMNHAAAGRLVNTFAGQ